MGIWEPVMCLVTSVLHIYIQASGNVAFDGHIDSADDFDFCSVRYFIGGSSKPMFRLSDPDMQLYWQ